MNRSSRLKFVPAGILFTGILALGANAQAFPVPTAFTVDPGWTVASGGSGTSASPFIINGTINNTGGAVALSKKVTIHFELGSNNFFYLSTPSSSNISWVDGDIFKNIDPAPPLYLAGEVPYTTVTFTSTPHISGMYTPDLGNVVTTDYHIHMNYVVAPFSTGQVTLRLWGESVAPVPAAVYLFGSGLIGLVGLARRKMSA